MESMIAIVNVSPESPTLGMNKYEVRINKCVITTFEHYRRPGGLAQCLRAAAGAVERCDKEAVEDMLVEMFTREK